MPTRPSDPTLPQETITHAVLEIIRQVTLELHSQKREARAITLDSSLERDLGLDSLGRMEVLLRLERACGAQLSTQVLALAETPRDLLRAVQEAHTTAQPRLDLPVVAEAASAPVAGIPRSVRTLVEVLQWHADAYPTRRHIALYGEDEQLTEITYAALLQGAEAVAAGLQACDVRPGQTIALMLPTSRDFFLGFYGILLAGGIPVPIYPPARLTQLEEHLRRQVRILSNAGTVMLLTVPEARPLARLLRAHVEALQHVVTVPDLMSSGAKPIPPTIQPQDLACVQYTSGSTGNPKGVMLTHANLLANIQAMGQAVRMSANDVFVSWLPLYHDMGLIGAWLGSLYYACPLVLMSPLTFLARPARWLWAIHRHRGTLSAGPNFAYELCVRRLVDSDIVGLDLSSWRLAFNGAEPVSAATLTRFSTRFAPYGFRPEAMAPVYGLAEAALGVAFPPLRRVPQSDRIQRDPFVRSGQAIPAAADDTTALQIVPCGQPLPGYQIRLVDATGQEVGERQEGRLEFQGPSTTSGYFHNPEATQQLFHDGWLDSGDLAYMAEGTVYLTGRAKDIIIRAGRNIYPHELEEAVGNIPGLRRGCVAVFGSPDPASGTERLVILAETRATDATERAHLRQQVEAITVDLLGTPPDDVVLALPGDVLKTSSGKIRRAASREHYERGVLGQPARAVWWQVVRLALAGVLPHLRQRWRGLKALLYGAYFWGLGALMLLVVWPLVACMPWPARCRALLRTTMRVFLRLVGTPLTVQGSARLPAQGPYLLAANHASYLDGPVLTAALPSTMSYVAKRELAGNLGTRVLLQRLGTEFVERFDAQRGIADTQRLLAAVRQGRSLVFFPEGTFVRMAGLQPFRMGTFVVAAQAGAPVIPVSLRGTRSLLRATQWLPRRGRLWVTIGTPVMPQGNDWAAAVALRNAVRAQIAQACGEPDLGGQDEPEEQEPAGA